MSDYYLQKQIKSTRKNSKIFSDSEETEHPQLRNAQRFFRKPKAIQELIKFPSPNIQYVAPYVPGPPSIPEAIKQIDKKIMAYRKVMEIAQKQKQILEQQKKMETEEEEKKEIDYLTNPQIQQQIDQSEKQDDLQNETTAPPLNQIKSQEISRQAKQWSYSETVQRRNQIYENTILRLYEKRQNPAFFAKLKKKTPALNITSKNKISIGSGRIDPEEHKLRIYNRENVPTMPELMIPSFMIKKDSMAKNILAYLKDYSPMYREQNHKEYPKCVQNILQEGEDISVLNE